MGTKFVMDSSKTSFAEVPTLLSRHVSAGDKPALSQLLQGLRQPALSAVTQQRRQGTKTRHLGREEKKKREQQYPTKQTYCPFY